MRRSTLISEVVWMKRFLILLTALILLFSACAFSLAEEEGDDSNPVPIEGEEGDDSNPQPVDMMEDEELDTKEEILKGRVLQFGDDGEDVTALQTRLKELKYYTGNLSGRYREGTRKAVETFQADFDLDQTGVADLRTLSILFSLNHRPLRYGSSGDDVKDLQKQLTELGYYKKAVETLQKKNNLEVNGVADSDLQDMLGEGRVLSKSEKPDDTATPAPNLSYYLVDDNENGVAVADIVFEKKLKSGSSGKLVKTMQERLTELGYYEGPISGNFQKYTTRAVKAAQTQNGLESTGVVDEATWNVIFNDPRIVLPGATPKPTPEPTPVPFHIVVDVANQVTSVYGRDEKGEYTVPVRQMLCSTGMKATPSDVGDWVLNGRHSTWCIFPKWGNSYARYWTRINSSIAFHSPIYTAVSNSAMKISSYNKLGQRASHGCIRLAVWDAKWIYDNVGAGTYSLDNVPQLGKRQLKEKSEGEDVFWLQQTLKDLGYYDTKVTGKMLKKTVKAVKAFQQDHGLKANGGVTQELMDLIAETARNAKNPQETPAPIATPAP